MSDPGTHPQLRTPPWREAGTRRAGAAWRGLGTGVDTAPDSAWPPPGRRCGHKCFRPPPGCSVKWPGSLVLEPGRRLRRGSGVWVPRERPLPAAKACEACWAAPCLGKLGARPLGLPKPTLGRHPHTTRPVGLLASPLGWCPGLGRCDLSTGPSKAEAPTGLSYSQAPPPPTPKPKTTTRFWGLQRRGSWFLTGLCQF